MSVAYATPPSYDQNGHTQPNVFAYPTTLENVDANLEQLRQQTMLDRHIDTLAPQQNVDHITTPQSVGDDDFYEIIGNEPLLGRLEDTSHSDAQKQAREDVHEQLSTSPEQRAADMQQLEALLNIGDRVALFREQHDLVSGAQ